MMAAMCTAGFILHCQYNQLYPTMLAQGVFTSLTSMSSLLPLLLLLPHQVGSTTGVGLAEGRRGAVKWSQLARMFAGWVFTLIIGGVISGVLFAWVSGWSPSHMHLA
jgi:hypothetical protein